MNEIEVGQVLAMAITLDPKMPEPDVDGFMRRLWTAALHDVPAELGQRAVVEYYRSDRYAQTRETISPADIVQWSNGHRRPTERERSGENAATKRSRPRLPADPELIHAGVDRVIAALRQRRAIAAGEEPEMAVAIAEGEAVVRRDYRSRRCGHCQALEGQPCVDHRGRPLTKSAAHDARIQAAEVAARAGRDVAVAELVQVDPGEFSHA